MKALAGIIRELLARVVMWRAARKLPFRIVVPDEREKGCSSRCLGASLPELRLYRPSSFYRRLGGSGLIGFGEAYQARDWDSDDLPALLTTFAAGLDVFVPRALQDIRGHSAARRHPPADDETIEGARKNAQHHYDLPAKLFEVFLDQSMTYSSALFMTDNCGQPIAQRDLLADAQCRKIDRLLDLVGVAPGTHLLEIGTGWGELAIRAARRGAVVDSVTNSAEQAKLAQDRIAAAGMAGSVNVDLRDYRELVDGRREYDSIVSIEMIEAVGERYWPEYFRLLGTLLAPTGQVGLQAITMRHDRMAKSRRTYTWIHKYIFPGGLIPSIESISDNLASYTDLRVLDNYAFGSHYAETLRIWREQFNERWPEVAAAGFDETFRRTWEFYLAYCEAGFASGHLNVHQLLIGR